MSNEIPSRSVDQSVFASSPDNLNRIVVPSHIVCGAGIMILGSRIIYPYSNDKSAENQKKKEEKRKKGIHISISLAYEYFLKPKICPIK